MKTLLIAISILLLTASASLAASLEFGWSYTAADQAGIVGFRLYRDGTVVDKDAIPAAARTVTVPRQTDKKSHTYHLTAYSADAESAPSATVIDAYVAATVSPVSGALTIKVIQ